MLNSNQRIDLLSFRKEKNFTQKELAAALGIKQGSISKYETGRARSRRLEVRILETFPKAKKYITSAIELFQDPVINQQAEEIQYLRRMNRELLTIVKESQNNYVQLESLTEEPKNEKDITDGQDFSE